MQLTCPCRYAHFPFDAALSDAAAREAVAEAAQMYGISVELAEKILGGDA